MEKLLVILAVVIIVGGALSYIIKQKKKGRKCIGCPYSSECQKNSCCK